MPVIIQGSNSNIRYSSEDDYTEFYKERYPEGIVLRPDSEEHQKLIKLVMGLARDSFDCISKRHASWNSIDEVLTVYKPADSKEVDQQKVDSRTPVSIVVPSMYAQLETLMTYLTISFLDGDIFLYEGRAEDYVAAKLLQYVINRQCEWFKAPLAIHSCMRSGLAYGIGASSLFWDKKEGWMRTIKQGVITDSSGQLYNAGNNISREWGVEFEGNRIDNIDPYKLLPDANVSITEFQNGEYFGWIEDTNYMRLLDGERNDNTLFNVKYLKIFKDQSFTGVFGGDNSRRDKHDVKGSSRKGNIPLINMFVKLIPKDYKLSDEEYPQKWLFTIAAESVVVRALPLDLDHNKFPVAVNAPDFDGYSVTPVSRLEMLLGLQTSLDWLFNSHMTNVRKAINDSLIVDPSLINMNDFNQEGPGRLIRMRRAAWGRGVETAVKQLQVTDITAHNISDASFIMDIMQRVSSATDSTMGIMRQGGERRSAAEYRGTSMSAMSRLEHISKMISLQYMYDLGYLMLKHTQQFMSNPVYMKVLGNLPDEYRSEYGEGIVIDPMSIAAPIDVIIKDGSLPSKGVENLESWVQLFQAIASNELLAQRFDIVRIFKHMARLMGAKNLNDFEIKAAVVPNESVSSEVQKGNLVPITPARAA
jgi:hypothetical protein